MKYRKLPVEIEAVQWTGKNVEEIESFVKDKHTLVEDYLFIHTLEGSMKAKVGDYIIKGIKGEFYPCDEQIFKSTYEQV
jgi:hypothetical protein